MKDIVRNRLIFAGAPETLAELSERLGSPDGTKPLDFERILPQNPVKAELTDRILYRNQTVLEYTFETEDQPLFPLFEQIAIQYPHVRLRAEYAGRDYGENCGICVSEAGSSSLEQRLPDDPFEFACLLWDMDPEEEMQERMINFCEE